MAVTIKKMNEEDNKTQSKQPGQPIEPGLEVSAHSPVLGFDSPQYIFDMQVT